MFEKILFPIGQSLEAIKTTTQAIALSRQDRSRLILLSVVQENCPEMANQDSVASLLNQAREKFIQAGIVFESLEKAGNPAFVICDVADELNVDLIIMGTKGINLEKDQESTASRVLQLSPCPVLVVP